MISFNILQTYLIRSVQYHASTFKTFTLSFGVMNFPTISKLTYSKFTYAYVSKDAQIYGLYISLNQKIWSQMLSKNRQKFAKPNIYRQTLSKFARFPVSGDKFADMATLTCFPCSCTSFVSIMT